MLPNFFFPLSSYQSWSFSYPSLINKSPVTSLNKSLCWFVNALRQSPTLPLRNVGEFFWIDAFAQDADGGLPVASWCETTFNGVIKHDPDSRLASRDEILKAQQEHLGMIQPAQVWFETLVYVGKGW